MTLLCAWLAGAASASESAGSMAVSGWANAPVGHVVFCRHFPEQCVAQGAAGPVVLDDAHWAELERVNSSVNAAIAPATDMQIYRMEELWTLPGTTGDCEDYVLMKRKQLLERGWPTSALLIAVVFDEVGDGHAVLIARTTHGDFTLDNKTDDIRLWNRTGYRFVKRQSDLDPRKWVSVGDPGSATRTTAAPQ
jgi:predicted transglutaminase-like cysteine proteinase